MSTSMNLEMSENMRSRSKGGDVGAQYDRGAFVQNGNTDPYFNTGTGYQHPSVRAPHHVSLDEDGYRVGVGNRNNTPIMHTFVDVSDPSDKKERRPRIEPKKRSFISRCLCMLCCCNCFCVRTWKGLFLSLILLTMASSLAFIFYHEQIRQRYNEFDIHDLQAQVVSTIAKIPQLSQAKEEVAPVTQQAAVTTTTTTNPPVVALKEESKDKKKGNTLSTNKKDVVLANNKKKDTGKKDKKPIDKKKKKPIKARKDDYDDEDDDEYDDDDEDDEDEDEPPKKKKPLKKPIGGKKVVDNKKKVAPKKKEKDIVEEVKKILSNKKSSPAAKKEDPKKRIAREVESIKKEAHESNLDKADEEGVQQPLGHFSKKASEITDQELEDTIRVHYLLHGHLEHMFDELTSEEQDRLADYLKKNHETVLKIMAEHQEAVERERLKAEDEIKLKIAVEQAAKAAELIKQAEEQIKSDSTTSTTSTSTTKEAVKSKTPFNQLLKNFGGKITNNKKKGTEKKPKAEIKKVSNNKKKKVVDKKKPKKVVKKKQQPTKQEKKKSNAPITGKKDKKTPQEYANILDKAFSNNKKKSK